MSDPTDNDLMSAFEPLVTNANRRNTKRRSSILKAVDINCGNEERRVSRRVSWAQTYQYKELLADGTTVVMLQQLNSHKSEEIVTSDPLPEVDKTNDENKDQNSNKVEEKINASDFISRLKANNSMNKSFSENPNECQNTEEVNEICVAKKPKKGKKGSSKGLTKFLSKHYEFEDQKDYDTVCNTSFNKYGREIVPRTERPDFTQLFVEEDMNLTKMTEVSEEHNKTSAMSLTLNVSTQEFSAEEKTHYFTDQSLAITEESIDCIPINEVSIESTNEQNSESDPNKSVIDFNRSFSVYSVESFRKFERQDMTALLSNNSDQLIDFTQPLMKGCEQSINRNSMEMSISLDSSAHDLTKNVCPIDPTVEQQLESENNSIEVQQKRDETYEESQQSLSQTDIDDISDTVPPIEDMEVTAMDDRQQTQHSIQIPIESNEAQEILEPIVSKSDEQSSVRFQDKQQLSEDMEIVSEEDQQKTQSFNVYNAESFGKFERQDMTEMLSNNSNHLINFTQPLMKGCEQSLNRNSIAMSISLDSTAQEFKQIDSPTDAAVEQQLESEDNPMEVKQKRDQIFEESQLSVSQIEMEDISDAVPPIEDMEVTAMEDQTQHSLQISVESKEAQEISEPIVSTVLQQQPEDMATEDVPEQTQHSLQIPIESNEAQNILEPIASTVPQLQQQPEEVGAEEVLEQTQHSLQTPVESNEAQEISEPIASKAEEQPSVRFQDKQQLSKGSVGSVGKKKCDSSLIFSNMFGLRTTGSLKRKREQIHALSLRNVSHIPMEDISDSVPQLQQQPEEMATEKVREQTQQSLQIAVESNEAQEIVEPIAFKADEQPSVRFQDKQQLSKFNVRSVGPKKRDSSLIFSNMFGLGMTERLKQKRDEIHAMSLRNVSHIPVEDNTDNVPQLQLQPEEMATEDVPDQAQQSFHIPIETNETQDVLQSIDSKTEEQTEISFKIADQPQLEVMEMQTIDCKPEASVEQQIQSEEESQEDDSKEVDSSDLDSNETEENSSNTTSKSSPMESSKSSTKFSDSMTTSPLSISYVHSSDNFLVSSPTTIDPTLNFTFSHPSDSSNSFDPFVHTNRSFHTDHSFYDTTSPMQLSFMVREDTLCILADELERQIEDIVIPIEEQKLSISSVEELNDMFFLLRKLDAKQNGFTYEVLNEEKALISYLWGTFALEIRFGKVIEDPNSVITVREIVSINMKSLIGSEEPLQMRQKDLILKFNDLHKPLLTIAHDLIISSFESERQHFISKHKTSASLHQLISDISVKVLSAKGLLTELRVISSQEVSRLYPKENDCYRLVIEILGIRKPIYLIIPINAKSYPDEVIHPTIKIRNEDKHLYCLEQFSAAFLRIEGRKFDYIRRLIRGTKAFVRAKKKMIYEKQKSLKQKNAIKCAKLPDSVTKPSVPSL